MICEPKLSLRQWRRGARTVAGVDGRIRTAEVMTSTGAVLRPVNKLAILEILHEMDTNKHHKRNKIRFVIYLPIAENSSRQFNFEKCQSTNSSFILVSIYVRKCINNCAFDV